MNELKKIAEFRDVLADYRLSESAKETLASTPLVLLVGPTSSGRNTIIEKLLETEDYYRVVSDTTREVRTKNGAPIEKNGREYWFRSEAEVLAELKRGEFLEAALIHEQQVSGISVREIEHAHEAAKIPITDVEPNGADTIHHLKPDAKLIFVLPPSFDVWMTRLHNRSDLPEDELRRRLTAAHTEIGMALERKYYTFVVNTQISEVVADIDAIARQHHYNPESQRAARELASQLREDVAAYLSKPTADSLL